MKYTNIDPNNNNSSDSFKDYLKEASLFVSSFKSDFNVDDTGLSSLEVEERIKKYGHNIISSKKPKAWYNYFLDSLLSPFNTILLCIVLVLFYTDVYLPSTPSYANIIVILILVLTSTILEFFQEYRSNRAAEKLKDLVATTTSVIRNGIESNIPIKDITLRRHCTSFYRKYGT